METSLASDSSKSATPVSKAATPLMQQYLGIKQRYPDEILFFRLGDFYEMFFEDAIKAAPLLEVTLTQRQTIPMCGVPYHAATSYISKLLKAGVSVAIAEQLEDPKSTKGMVKRDVVRIMTPGTLVEDELLLSKANNFLVAISGLGENKKGFSHWALAAADVSTGQQWVAEAQNDFHFNKLKSHLASLSPSEVLLVGAKMGSVPELNTGRAVVRYEPVPADGAGLQEQALGAIQGYLKRDHPDAVKSLKPPQALPSETNGFLFLDETAIRHLELVTPADPLHPGPTLFSVLDRCVTALGSRILRWWVLHPLLNVNQINARLLQVEEFFQDSLRRDSMRSTLNGVADIERISVRSQAGSASPRDLEALRATLRKLPSLREIIGKDRDIFSQIFDSLTPPAELLSILEAQLSEEPPAKLIDGGVIREGVSVALDELRSLRRNGKKWIAEMEAQERERTGIGSLKVGYNDIFGYYLEVSKTNLSKVPSNWIRKQTMANGERYITPALKEQEEKILGAEAKIIALETQLYAELVHHVSRFGPTLGLIAEALAQLDAVSALAHVAAENNFVRPNVHDGLSLQIKGGRHVVVEKQIGRDRFIPNDVDLNEAGRRIAIITGPNMAGKSTYLRQTALICIMGQMGSFVPAESASIGVIDKIFTRIGASDRLSQGQSTFMVEMKEVSSLLGYCTERSLLILDEVGRGTSTYDGVSIAWAVIEHLSRIKPRTLFATHYFELTDLDESLPGVFNAHATAKEWPGPDGRRQVVFLYQILPGPADRSYGIHVAEMAGLPETCVARAREILHQLELGSSKISIESKSNAQKPSQLEFFSEHPIVSDLKKISLDEMTPLEALNQLAELKKKVNAK